VIDVQASLKKCAVLWTGLNILCGLSACATVSNDQDAWFGEDKARHFVVAAVLGAGVTAAAQQHDVADCDAPTVGVVTVIGFGAGKEVYDKRVKGTYWSWKDMTWNVVGATVGSLAASRCR
jgi:putative lipoprotein